MSPMQPGFASFRDPDGSVFSLAGRIFRSVTPSGAATLRAALETPGVARMFSEGRIVATSPVDAEALGSAASECRAAGQTEFFEHERIPFPSYPYEWPPEMLWEAGCLTLALALAVIPPQFELLNWAPRSPLWRRNNWGAPA